ncbi:hypothetical protein Q8G40_30870, partial [Klebsiella pneumoniae]|uniref:hypothetical protein n=1 Tax=Klebsiella pneumoniae TaxID=573 RepID=UPI003013B17D
AAHQGAPVAGLPLGDWRNPESPAAEPAAPPPAAVSAGAALTINKAGEAFSIPSGRRGGGVTPASGIEAGGTGAFEA